MTPTGSSAVPTHNPTTKRKSRRPWWVAPGLGALLGALAIALAAQGSLAGARVGLPGGPRLAISDGTPPTTTASTPVPGVDDNVVTPVLPVVTQNVEPNSTSHAGSGGGTSGWSRTATSGSWTSTPGVPSGASGPDGGIGAVPTAGPGGTAPATTEDPGSTGIPSTTTTTAPSTPTTTRPQREPGDT